MSTHTETLIKDDACITNRNRELRFLVAIATPFVLMLGGGLIGHALTWWFDLPAFIGWAAGVTFGAFYIRPLWMKSRILNGATIGFMTVDRLASLFPWLAEVLGLTTLTWYGPGEHFCFWWEERYEINVIDLSEATEPVHIIVQTDSGELTLKGEVRHRADLERLPEYIYGAASVASNSIGLVEAHVVGMMSKKKIPLREALKSIEKINRSLANEFQAHKSSPVTNFEKRFAVTVGDATISQILPSKEVREVLSAVTESQVMDEMVAASFGCENYLDLVKKVEAGGQGNPTWTQVNQVRTQKMASSGNLQGMDLKDHTINVNLTGLEALTPEIAAAFGTALGMWGNSKKGNQKKGSAT